MKNAHTKSEKVPNGQGDENELLEVIKRMASELGQMRKANWATLRHVENIDRTMESFAAQKYREMTPESPEGGQAA